MNDIRVKIAHTLFESGAVLGSPDDPLDIRNIQQWLPLMKCIARLVLLRECPDLYKPAGK
ncbi:MAG: hypothetical protein ABI051_02925 [Vicinamibacterales bacterium]